MKKGDKMIRYDKTGNTNVFWRNNQVIRAKRVEACL
jgi:hypothetical protein